MLPFQREVVRGGYRAALGPDLVGDDVRFEVEMSLSWTMVKTWLVEIYENHVVGRRRADSTEASVW